MALSNNNGENNVNLCNEIIAELENISLNARKQAQLLRNVDYNDDLAVMEAINNLTLELNTKDAFPKLNFLKDVDELSSNPH
jgi:hypothetical protein